MTKVDLKRLSMQYQLLALTGKALQVYPDQDAKAWFDTLAAQDAFRRALAGFADLRDSNHPASEAVALIGRWFSDVYLPDPESALRELEYDYTGLLIGPGNPAAPPWGSIYLDGPGLLFQASTSRVRAWYISHGVELDTKQSEPDDFIGYELSFLGLLTYSAMQKFKADDVDGGKLLLENRSDFFDENLGQWGETWAKKAIDAAKSDFYKGISQLVLAICQRKLD